MNVPSCLLIAMWPGNASSPTFGKPRVPDAIRTPGPYRTRFVLKPLRTRRVVVSRFTRPTEPSYGTVCMNVYADSPSSALTSGKSFSCVSKSSVPAGASARSVLATVDPLLGLGSHGARAGRSFRIANAFLPARHGRSQARCPAFPPFCRPRADRRSSRYVHHKKRNGLTRPFRMVHIAFPKVDVDHPSLLRLRDPADGLGDRREGRQGARRARLVAPAAGQA